MQAGAQNSPAVSVVMPCYNEEECLRQTAGGLVRAFAAQGLSLELVLVDNGSRDRTGEIIDGLMAEGLPVVKVRVKVNQGYGHGVLEGLRRCTAPVVGFLCADGQVSAEDTVKTYQEVQNAGRPILAKVRRRFRKDSWRRKLVSALYNVGMQGVFGWLGSIDLNGNPKVMPREILRVMDLQSKDWFLDPEIMIKAGYLGLPILEWDVEGLHRQGGKSNVRYSTCLQFARNILMYRLGGPLRQWKKTVKPLTFKPTAKSAPAPGARETPRP